jgi:hypothetical protein
MVADRRGGSDPGDSELIVIGSDIYSRTGTGPWRKDSAAGLLATIPHWLPDALVGDYAAGELKLVCRDAAGSSLQLTTVRDFAEESAAMGRPWLACRDGF